jgi:hypothetical protein
VLTKDILFGMNILILAGFVVMGFILTLNRMGQTRKALSSWSRGLRWSSLGCTQEDGRGRATEPRAGASRMPLAPIRLPSHRGFSPPYEISYGGLKLPRVSAALGRFHLRRWAGLPQVGHQRSGPALCYGKGR